MTNEEKYVEFIDGNPLISSEEDKKILRHLLELRERHMRGFSSLFRSKENKAYLDWLNSKTPLLQDGTYTIATKLYWVAHGLVDFPKCQVCGKNVLRYNVSFDHGYIHACSPECASSNPKRQEKTRSTMLRKYGCSNYFRSEEGKAKRQAWLDERGISNPFQDEEVKEASRKSRKEHFGCEYTMQSEEKRRLASKNYEKKTGYKHQFQDPEVKAKAKHTIQAKKSSGVDSYEKNRLTNRKKRYKLMMQNEEVIPNFSLDDFMHLNHTTQYTTLLSWHCRRCNSDFNAFLDQNFSSREGIPARCTKCHPILAGISEQELELQRFLVDELGLKAEFNTKKIISPLELDAYLPDKKIAIEFDGLFWHSDGANEQFKDYHLTKTRMCESRGIQLIHIFEDEWLEKNEIVKSRLRNLVGKFENTIFARSCQVLEITSSESLKFQKENHIQGPVKAKVNLGLICKDHLVSVMTFGRSRFDKKVKWEMLRFCNKLNYHIPGAAGKLLKHFERNYQPESLISYADRRWSQGKLYKALCFNLVRTSSPNYWYCKNQTRFSRIRFQKHRLKEVLENYDADKTEVENMKSNGYHRIFDCGNLVFLKEYSKT